jgi:carbonic anhydrase/acetyltransferase-like protein (isoleucine patch superfamily)
VRRSLDTPWKVWNELARWWVYPAVRLAFALNGIAWGRGWRFYGAPILQKHRLGRVSFGDGLQLRSTPRSNPLGPHRPVILCAWQAGAVLQVGADFAMSGGTLCAAESIRIGDRVTIGANSVIVDTDFHPLDPGERLREPERTPAAPIVIEDDVFIGMGCYILKGVTLGRGCVVGAGSVVTRAVPAGMIAAGNPAREIRAVGPAPGR